MIFNDIEEHGTHYVSKISSNKLAYCIISTAISGKRLFGKWNIARKKTVSFKTIWFGFDELAFSFISTHIHTHYYEQVAGELLEIEWSGCG